MKIIHCADLHLDSKMNSNLDKDKAKLRRGELLDTYSRMIDYARETEVGAILISGDLFDTKNISATARNVVIKSIESNPEISFYYLKGNHDSDNFLSGIDELPENLHLFTDKWTTYYEGDGRIAITGIELSDGNSGAAYSTLVNDASLFNIIMLHGQETENGGGDRSEIINLRSLKGHGIDYLALGHVHAYKTEPLDMRGTYCYPGCLEGRGFDECGEHGFVLLDIDEGNNTYEMEFVPFAKRQLYTVYVDVSGLYTSPDIMASINKRIEECGCDSSSLIKVVLTGSTDVEDEKDTDYILAGLSSRFFFVKIYDETVMSIDPEEYKYDESLKGEFVRLVLEDESILPEDKAAVIHYGIMALIGEEV